LHTLATARSGHGTSPPAAHAGPAPTHSSSAGKQLLGLELPPERGQAMMVALIAFAAMLLLAVLFADRLQLAPRYRALVARFTQRPRD
jgi:hypothetical protein